MPKRSVHPLGAALLFLAVAVLDQAMAQQPLLSPRDSVQARFNGARVSVDYGRPSMRGRTIMGGLVPFNRWWRTGANEATSFRTEADLLIGDSLVPAGNYTLYTLPGEKRWKLIINKQTGQWGTVYNADLDLVRVPMTRRTLTAPVDTFTIRLEKRNGTSGLLRLQWETTDVSVPVRLRTQAAGRTPRR